MLIIGRSCIKLGQDIAKSLNIKPIDCRIFDFNDSEIGVEINESVRGKSIFVLQSITNPANQNLMELLIIIDALKRASAKEINVIIPYFGYARQDRKCHIRGAIPSKLIADLLETSGSTRIMTIDLHSPQIEGFFNIPLDNLSASSISSST